MSGSIQNVCLRDVFEKMSPSGFSSRDNFCETYPSDKHFKCHPSLRAITDNVGDNCELNRTYQRPAKRDDRCLLHE